MIPTENQLDKLNNEFEQYGWTINRDEYNTIAFDTSKDLLKHFTDEKIENDFGNDADIEMWLEENYIIEVYYSDIQSMYFVAIS